MINKFNNIIISEFSSIRKNISKQKNRGEISFSNKKPWKQKGTGNARSGRKSSPIWRKGGRSFTNGKENYKKKINKRVLYFFKKNIILHKKIFIIEDFIINICKPEKSIFIYEKKYNIYNNIIKKYKIIKKKISKITNIDIIKYKNLIFTKRSLKYFKSDKYNKKIQKNTSEFKNNKNKKLQI